MPALINALKAPYRDVRQGTAIALGEIRSAAAEAVPALVDAFNDPDKGVRQSAANALKKIQDREC